MENYLGIFENHHFSHEMSKRHNQRGHYTAFRFTNAEVKVRELNNGRTVNTRYHGRVGQLTRPLCDNPNWRLTSLFNIEGSKHLVDSTVRWVLKLGSVPLGMERVKDLLKLDDQIRSRGAQPLSVVSHGVHLIRVPETKGSDIEKDSDLDMNLYQHKIMRDHSIVTLLKEENIMFEHLI